MAQFPSFLRLNNILVNVYTTSSLSIYLSMTIKVGSQWHSGEESAFSAGDAEDTGSNPGTGRSPGGGTHSSILVGKIPWPEKPGGLHSMG